MTSNHSATSGTMLERGAVVAVWRQLEQILAAGIAYPATPFANVPEVLRRTGRITKSRAGFNVTDCLRKRSRMRGVSHEPQLVRRSNIDCQRPVLWIENVEVAWQRTPVQYRFMHFALPRAQLMVEHDL
jgi:GntR family phosphonate transport system transcriptional regulator